MTEGRAWQGIPRAAFRVTVAAALGIVAGASANVRPAQAHHNWVGPAIAGLVIGGVLANEYNRHHYRYYSYPKVKYRRHTRRYYAPYPYYRPYYGPPAIVVPLPVPFFAVPGY